MATRRRVTPPTRKPRPKFFHLNWMVTGDLTIRDDSGNVVTPEEAEALYSAGQVTSCNVAFTRLRDHDFNVEAAFASYKIPRYVLKVRSVEPYRDEPWQFITEMGPGGRADAMTFTRAEADRFVELYGSVPGEPDLHFEVTPV